MNSQQSRDVADQWTNQLPRWSRHTAGPCRCWTGQVTGECPDSPIKQNLNLFIILIQRTVFTHLLQHSFLEKTLLFGSHDKVMSVVLVVDNVLKINTRLTLQILMFHAKNSLVPITESLEIGLFR